MLNALFPALNYLDAQLASFLPLAIRVCLWGAIGGATAILVYALASDQRAIAALKAETRNLRKQAMKLDLDNSAAIAIAMRNLKVSLALLGRAAGPSLVSLPPVLVFAAWLFTYHGYQTPGGAGAVSLTVLPEGLGEVSVRPPEAAALGESRELSLIPSAAMDRIEVHVNGRLVYAGNPLSPPAPVIGKEDGWNLLFASEAGYVEADGPVSEIHIGFPIKRLLPGLPDWASGWELPFFLAAFAGALAVKFGFGIE